MKPETKAKIHIVRDPEPMGSQVEAITNLEQNLIISAGAGSGKTWVLTERYLEILSRGYSPSEIIAITFTRKAAGEMKGRIRQAIQKMARQAADEDEKKYWNQCEQEFKHSIITTIDGFCSELLRAHPLEAGLGPQFRVLDSIEADLLKLDIYTQTTRDLLDREPVSEEMVQLYEELSSVDSIVSHAFAMDHKLKTFHKTPQDLRDETRQAIERYCRTYQSRARRLIGGIDEMIALLQEEIEKANPKRAYMLDMEDWFRRYADIRDAFANCSGLADEALYEKLLDLHRNRWRSPGRGKVAEYTRTLRENLKELFKWIVPIRYRDVAEALLRVVAEADKQYEAYKVREQAVDFHDIEIATARLLDCYPEICEKWQRRVSFLMIDEFQDTNELQKSIFDRLSGDGQKMRLFVVGDGKQSIYRFRGADIEVFYQVEREIVEQQGGLKLSLARNFRSQRGVIEYINALFERAMAREEEDPAYVTQYERLEAHRTTDKSNPHVEFICASREPTSEEEEELTGARKQADLIARRVKQMVDEKEKLVWRQSGESRQECATSVAYGDIAILLATRSNMHLYEFAFQEYGIPYVVIGGRQYYEKQEVLDVINLLRMLLNEADDVSLLAFLRSPFARLSDETLFWLTRERSLRNSFEHLKRKPEQIDADQWRNVVKARERVKRWRQQKGWLTAAELLKGIIEETGYRMMLIADPQGDQKVANVDKFVQLTERLVDEKGFLLYDVVQHFERMREEEIKEEEASVVSDHGDAVVMMSAHASKGLEFPVVFIPELEKDQLKKGGGARRFFYHPEYGAGIRLRELGSGRGEDGPGHGVIESMKQDEEKREEQEAIRLFYVAMTRAKDHLVLVATEWDERRKPRFSWLALLVERLLGWDSLERRKQIAEPIQTDDWKMSVLCEEHIPKYPKKSEYRARLEDWVEDPSAFTDRDLPEFPLMDRKERPYGWQQSSVVALPRLSASALMQYERCPRKFYLQYIEGMYGLDDLFKSLGSSTAARSNSHLSAMDRGTIVHRLIETESAIHDEEELVRKAIVNMLERSKDVSEALEEVRPYLKGYRSFMERHQMTEYETEKSFTYIWDGHPLYGQLDRIVYHPDGEMTIFDFKTNRVQENVESIAQSYFLQGYLYVELAERVMKRKVKAMNFVFLERDEEYALPLDDANRERYRRKISRLIAELKEKTKSDDFASCQQSDCVCQWAR